ncbi:CYTH and CHAD domain-containing protein [Aquibium carbonis]|uniref:CYTH and CHAD domain-containing protein n=1 Tax=Aquibium carbonis TaxID=2495581 RepID=A0A3R9ZZW2_9HYPH|nr:CYTH and CHAD domain-containing protein [Aquibium carbonis]RST85697.1 CYTH and CHAD domain-containing protein [Aquibium carbonis]
MAAPRRKPAAPAAAREIELKLVAPPAAIDDLAKAGMVVAHARNMGTVRNLGSVYFDTPDRALTAAGFALRVRSVGRSRIMTVKSAGGGAGDGLVGRGEWEVGILGDAPDLGVLPDGVPKAFRALVADAPLEPVVTTTVRRRARKLDLPNACIELAIDSGTVEAGGRVVALSEIELELVSGEVGALYDVALDMLEHGPAEMSLYSKAARGFDLAFDRPPAWRKPLRPAVSRSVALDDAFAVMLSESLRHFLDNRPAAMDGRHPEGIHQTRVALRRLRSILKVIADATGSAAATGFAQDARWLAGEQGDARGFDVFLAETIPPVEEACADPSGFAAVRAAVQPLHEAAYARARAALADRRALRLPLALARWIEGHGWRGEADADALAVLGAPAAGFAGTVLDRQVRKALKRGRRFARLDAEGRHEVRLAVKKLRYLSDFLLPLCARDKKAAGFAKALSRIQDGLGRYNDIATTDQLLDRLAGPEAPPSVHRACGEIRGWQARDLAAMEADLRLRWKAFSSAKMPWPD